MDTDRELRFYPKAKVIFIVGLLLTLSDVLFWQPGRHFLINTAVVGSGMVTGFVVFYAFYKRINVAKYAIYFLALLVTLCFVLYLRMPPLQRAALIANAVVFYGVIAVLLLFRKEANEYFRTAGSAILVKVAYILVLVLTVVVTVLAMFYQLHLKAGSEEAVADIEKNLILEGTTTNTAAIDVCKEKYAGNDMNEEQLHKFCTCVVLNFDEIMRNASEDTSGVTALLTKSMAISEACMKRIKQ